MMLRAASVQQWRGVRRLDLKLREIELIGIFHNHAIGLVLAAGALLIANTSHAKVPVAPLKSATAVRNLSRLQVFEQCVAEHWHDIRAGKLGVA